MSLWLNTSIVVECTEGWFSSEGKLQSGGQDPGSPTSKRIVAPTVFIKGLVDTDTNAVWTKNNDCIDANNDDVSGKPMMLQRHLTTTPTKHKPSHIPTHLCSTRTYRCHSSRMIAAMMATATAVIDVGGIAVVNGTRHYAC